MKTQPKAEPGIYEKTKGSGVWWCSFVDAAGKQRRLKCGSWSRAKAKRDLERGNALEGKLLPDTRKRGVLFSELIADMLIYSRAHKRGFVQDRYRAKVLTARFGHLEAAKITSTELTKGFGEESAQQGGWAASTLNQYKALVSLCFRLGIESKKVSCENPAKGIRHVKEDNARIRFLSDAEEIKLRAAIRAHCPQRMPELDFALATGVRRGSQFQLTFDTVNVKNRTAFFPADNERRQRFSRTAECNGARRR